MLNIVIPMAGAGSRFVKAGYTHPKPFIDVSGVSMIKRVLQNLTTTGARFILLAREQHVAGYDKDLAALQEDFPCDIFYVPQLTEGAACTVLSIAPQLNNDTPLLVANCDQIVDSGINGFLDDARTRNLDGSIMTFIEEDRDTKWSYAKLDGDGYVTEVQEKVPISSYATVGIYYFRKGSDYVASAARMIAYQDKTNNEYYLCPVYNYMIQAGNKIGIYNIDSTEMHGTGTPEDLRAYIDSLT